MICPGCGRTGRPDAAFCDRCGTRLPRACPSCGADTAADAGVCAQCGRPLAQAADAPGRELASYTPKHLADAILTQRSALEGARKHVTVMFADVQSSMALAEDVDPEDWHRILDRFFAILADGVHRYEGTVNQYTGDGIMALFGAPIAHEDHAHRACYAALHLSRELRDYAQHLRREQGLDFRVRMGLNSGEVVVGRIGDDLRMDYTAQGHTVGLAARMEKLAESGRTYLTDTTAELVAGHFELESLGEFKLRGIRKPVRAYALEGVGPHRTRLDVARARGFSRFVGRREELARLERARAAAAQGGRAVAIVADAGLGKSRLCHEFAERCGAAAIPVVTGYGTAHGRSLPFHPILELLRDAFELADDDDARQARRKIAGTLLLQDPDVAEDLPLLFDLLGVGDPGAPDPLVEGEGRQRRLFTILRRYLAARSREAPLVVLLEDLQWFDSASLAFLQDLLAGLDDTHVLLVLTYRTGVRVDWGGSEPAETIALAPLGTRDIDEMLEDLLGSDPSTAELRPLIRERALGNPFFVEEVVESLVESVPLLGRRGAYRLLRPVSEIAIPHTVHALIASRIDRLDAPAKQLLDTAAVIGKRFAEGVLRAVSPLPSDEFDHHLRALLDAGFVVEEALYPERTLAFVHPLTQEVAYQSQLSEPRGAVHALVARALEEHLQGSLDENAALIAHHWEQSGNALAAARFVHRAARWLGPSDPAEAMALWRRLLRLVEAAPATVELSFLAARACRWLLFLGGSQGMEEDEAERIFATGRDHSGRTRDPRSDALTLANYAYYRAQIVVDPRSSVERTREALELARASGRADVEITTGIRLAQALTFWGRFREAATLSHELLDRLSAPNAPAIDPLDYVTLYSTIGDALNELGRPREGVGLIERGLELAAERGLTLNAGYCHNAYVRHLALTRQSELAGHHAHEAMRAAERTGNRAMLAYAHDVLGLACQMRGDFAGAVENGRRAIELSERFGVARIVENAHRAHLASAYLWSGEPEAALAMAEQAVKVSERCGPRFAPRAHLVLARVLLESQGLGAAARIEACLDATDAILRQSEARIYEPFVAEERARLAGLRGQPEERRLLLEGARERYRALGLPLRADALDAELAG